MNLSPDGRIDSVSRDQAIATDFLPALKSCDNTVGILVERFHALTWDQAPLRQLAPKRPVQVRPMDAQGRGLKPRHRDCRNQLSVRAE
jgi:hypothetical protein